MSMFDGQRVRQELQKLFEKSGRVRTNVIHYYGPELGRLALAAGQRNTFGGYNWDTRVRNRSAKYTVVIGGPAVADRNPKAEQIETLDKLDLFMTRVFGGQYGEKTYRGQTSGVVASGMGFHIVQTLERQVHPLSAAAQRVLRQLMVESWLVDRRKSTSIEVFVEP